ncbi:MAG: hypothetical protein AAF650_06165 [Pseudomonadota bacterium]
MDVFHSLVVLHVIAGTIGLVAFWVPIVTRKGAAAHRKWGRVGCYGFIGAGALAIAMALISLYGPEERIPSFTDRRAFAGLFGWMMLYLGILTIGFIDYGLGVVKHGRARVPLRSFRYQVVIAAVVISGAWCGWYGYTIGNALMMGLAVLGVVSMSLQQVFIWRREAPSPKAYIGEHFRALIGMGISAYTAFLSVGLVRRFPEQVFNPLIWAIPSAIGVGLIIGFTLQAKQQAKQKAARKVQKSAAAKTLTADAAAARLGG